MLMLTFILIILNEGLNPGSILLDVIAYERIGMAIVSNHAMHLGSLYLMSVVKMYFFSEVNEPCTLCKKSMFLPSVVQ